MGWEAAAVSLPSAFEFTVYGLVPCNKWLKCCTPCCDSFAALELICFLHIVKDSLLFSGWLQALWKTWWITPSLKSRNLFLGASVMRTTLNMGYLVCNFYVLHMSLSLSPKQIYCLEYLHYYGWECHNPTYYLAQTMNFVALYLSHKNQYNSFS